MTFCLICFHSLYASCPRFPFLLQSPEEFCETLQRLNWRTVIDNNDVQRWLWEPTAEDRNGTCPWHFRTSGGSTDTETWVNLSELTQRLWLVPERLFQHVVPALPVSVLRQAIRLSEEEALAVDENTLFSQENVDIPVVVDRVFSLLDGDFWQREMSGKRIAIRVIDSLKRIFFELQPLVVGNSDTTQLLDELMTLLDDFQDPTHFADLVHGTQI